MSTQEKCANAFRIWTDQIRRMLIEFGEANAAARVDNYSFETFHAGWRDGEAAAIERCAKFMEARADEFVASGNCTANMMAAIYRDEAKSLRALLPK